MCTSPDYSPITQIVSIGLGLIHSPSSVSIVSIAIPDALSGFIDEADSSDKTLLLLNRTRPESVVRSLRRAFDHQPVSVSERAIPDGSENVILLIWEEEVLATSSLDSLLETFLLVNSDSYRTGTHGLAEMEPPDVITGLQELEFNLRGFPDSNSEKLLLVLISRFIEGRALAAATGRLDVSFQRLSRLDDEHGTRGVYERLTATDVDTHLYGVRDQPRLVVDDMDVTIHEGDHDEYRQSWFVVFTPPQGEDDHAALVATETGANEWRATWTYDPARVTRIRKYIRQYF